MTMPDYIKNTHQPKTMDTPAALTSDDIPPVPLSEDDLRRGWNQQADEHNQWESLDSGEQLAWAQAQAIKADRHAAALKAKPEEQRPTDEDLYDLSEQFHGDPVAAMRRALELWGGPLQGAPATGENPAAPPAPEDLATDQLMAASLSALLIKECGLHSPGSSTHDLLQRAAAMLVNYGLPARPAIPPAPEPVAWCRSDEFANSMNRGCSFNGWRDPGAGANKCDMQLYAIPLPAPVPVAVSERRPEGNWVDSLQHAIESVENDFLAGVCVSLAVVTAHGEATAWREIVRSVGTESLLNYVANVNPEDWEQAGFSKYAQAELGKGKPLPAPQAGEVEA